MIDTGKNGYNGGKSQAEILILKYLKDRGIKNIDTIIVTHFDNDHCGGTTDLIKMINVNKVYVNSLNHESYAAKNIYKTAAKQGIEIILAKNKQNVLKEGNLSVKNYIAPETIGIGDNETSILTLIQYNKFSMLFTGDAGIKTLNKLKKDLPANITVLKVGHHGANNVINNQILDYLNPQIAIISVGTNKFGHPSIQTLEILKNIKILRTDINNSIKFIVNNHDYKILTFDAQKKKYTLFN